MPATKARPVDKWVLGNHRFEEIPVAKLHLDHSYQRFINESGVEKIVRDFDWNLFEPVTVNVRGNGKSSTFYVIDGQHRVKAAKKLGIAALTARVVEVPLQDEPGLFIKLNRNRIWLAPIPAFKAELAQGNPAAIEITRCLTDRGLVIGLGKQPTEVAGVTAMKEIYARGGARGLGRALDTPLLSWHEDESRRFAGNVLLGIDVFYNKNRSADVARAGEKLSSLTPSLLLAKASQRWHARKALGSHVSQVECIAEEIAKVYRRRSS